MTTDDTLSLLRRGLLVVLAIGAMGLISELVLLEHYDDPPQFIPFVLLTLTLVVICWHWWDEKKRSLRALQAVMLLLVIAGPVGVMLHVRGNYLSETDLDPSLFGFDLWLQVFRGEAPVLAPGTLVQFGLLGLLYAYRHPALVGKDH